jgi:GNAT superfamily N-acetyltransferase
MSLNIIEADLNRPDHQDAVVAMIDAYAADPMGNGKRLDDDVRASLVPGLRKVPTSLIFLAYLDGNPVGIAACFHGFSTFAAKPLINIHDLSVVPGHRGHGIGRRLLEAVERKARSLGCCKVTLEVGADNRARRLYEAFGFSQTVYGGAGAALFFSKRL